MVRSKPPFSAAFFLSLHLLLSAALVPAHSCGTCTAGGGSFPYGPPGGQIPGSGSSGGGSGSPTATCPRDALKLGVCADLLNGLVGVVIGTPPTTPCCSLLAGLLDLEAAVCLCIAIRANILGINLNVRLSLSLIIDACGMSVPPGFVCA
ncbi:14 kDa proline-rich protein DC2.15-like [Malania oleifera]|uniref:14 kDa proline-rich protein DC2.15-like n=1 Tax=Malania oleifera TaxID=397392 RepID=UPI0025ADD8A3|nr:14 kDa proline-rich protein DC2.15-like [Malania oleifera]